MAPVTSVLSCLDQIDRPGGRQEVGYRAQDFAADDRRDQVWQNVWARGRGAIGTIMLEQHVLNPIPEAVLYDQTKWPIFDLYDVVVRESGRVAPTSLLAANAKVSVTVIGRLAGTGDYADLLINRGKSDTFIELQNVRYFAYGTSESDRVVLWAAGKAGWYEIHPAPEYRPIFDHMVKSVRLVHFLDDSSRKRRRGGAMVSVPVHTTFEEYARANRSDCADAEAAAETFHQHRDFLIATMLNKEEWGRLGLYHQFRSRYRRDFERIRAEHEPSSIAPLNHAGATASGDNGDNDDNDDNVNDMDNYNNPALPSASFSHGEKDDDKHDVTSAIPEVDALMGFARYLTGILVLLLGPESRMRGDFDIDACAVALHRRYDIPSEQHARNILRESAPELVRLIEEEDTVHSKLAVIPLYMQLREIVAKSRWSTRFLWQGLVPRKTSLDEGREGDEGDEGDEAGEAVDDGKSATDSDPSYKDEVGQQGSGSTARVVPQSGKSQSSFKPADNDRLDEQSDEHGDDRHARPSVARAPSRNRRLEPVNENDNDDDDDDGQHKPRTGSSTWNKRQASPAADTNSDIQPPNGSRHAKKARIGGNGAGAASIGPSQMQTTPLPPSEKAPPEIDFPKFATRESWRPTWPSHIFVEEDLPQHHLGGTGGTMGRRPEDILRSRRSRVRREYEDNRPWLCPMDGCQYTVWDHQRVSGQVWIRAHLQDHTDHLMPDAVERPGRNK